MAALIGHYDNSPLWVPVGTNKDNLEWPWMPDSTQSALYGRHAWPTFVAGFGFDHTHRCSQRGEREWTGGLSPSMWAADALFLCGSWASCNIIQAC